MPDKKPSKRKLLDDRRVVLAFSLLIAFVFWVVVAGFIMPADNRVLNNVIIDYTRGADAYEEQGLQLVSTPAEPYVDVDVRGDGAQLGPLSNGSVAVYPDYSQVRGAGVHEVPIRVTKVSTAAFNIYGWSVKGNGHSLEVSPKTTVTLTFEEVARKTFSVRVDSAGVTPAQGFFKDNENTRADPAQITVAGPRTRVELIDQVVARVAVEEERSERRLYRGENGEVELLLLDENGGELDAAALGLTLSAETADVEVPVLEIRTIGLTVDFIGKPDNLDEDWFNSRVRLSEDTLQVVGTAAAFANLENPYPIAAFNVSELSLGWEAPINITLPEGLRNNDELIQVTASFDASGLVEKTFEVDSITVVNGPQNLGIRPVADSITVKLIGEEEQMNALTPEDIMVQVDAFGLSASATGQQTVPARVLVPGAGRVIPEGGYSVICDVSVEN